MGGRKNHSKQLLKKQENASNQPEQEKRFVNLLHVYTIYKQKFRRLKKEEFEVLLRHGCKGKRAAIELCKDLMKSKQVPEEVNFEKNVGFLTYPRIMPLIALLAERAGYKLKPSLVNGVVFSDTPSRFKDKFSQLMVCGLWFLGRVISDSLSEKEQVNRGNMFNFLKGDLGFWWAAVRILDWNHYVHREKHPENCYSFVTKDPRKYRFNTTRAIINMHQHPLYFLSELDWQNYEATVKSVKHKFPLEMPLSFMFFGEKSVNDITSDDWTDDYESSNWNESSDWDGSSATYSSLNTLASRESID